jgi:hypothetical protein
LRFPFNLCGIATCIGGKYLSGNRRGLLQQSMPGRGRQGRIRDRIEIDNLSIERTADMHAVLD